MTVGGSSALAIKPGGYLAIAPVLARAARQTALVFVAAFLAGCGLGTAALANGGGPTPGVWGSYQGLTYSYRSERAAPSVTESHGHGYLPQFRIRLSGNSRVHIERLGTPSGDADRWGSLVLAIARLDLPAAESGRWFEYYRDNERWAWRHRRIREGARHVATEIDLRASPAAAAAQVCRAVEVEPLAAASVERCRIEAIVDPFDGWPIAVEITRSLEAPDGSHAREAVTFERLSDEQAQRLRPGR